MASGKTHDQSILLSTPIIGAIASYYKLAAYQDLFIFCLLYVFSGFYLSPDIDTKSVVFKRYGLIKFIWKPYQKLFPHRGNFFNRNFYTHFPIIATLIRLSYIGIPVLLVLHFNSFQHWQELTKYGLMLYLATEISSFVHLVFDVIYTKRH